MTNDEIYMAVAQDEEILEHYGRIGMKWYQHIYGDYQGAAKYAEKGSKKLAAAKQKDAFRGGGESARTKKLKNAVKAVNQEVKAAQKREEERSKQEVEKKLRKEASDRVKEEQKTEKAEAKAQADHEKKIMDLARGKEDWRKASKEDLLEAVGRLQVEKQFKDLQDDVSGAKVWKQAGATALNDLAKNTGNIVNTIAKPISEKVMDQWSKSRDAERKKESEKDTKGTKDKETETKENEQQSSSEAKIEKKEQKQAQKQQKQDEKKQKQYEKESVKRKEQQAKQNEAVAEKLLDDWKIFEKKQQAADASAAKQEAKQEAKKEKAEVKAQQKEEKRQNKESKARIKDWYKFQKKKNK